MVATNAGSRGGTTRHYEAAAELGRRIVAGEWVVGTALPTENDMARELGVSRASLREAVKMLAGKGLLQSAPRRGTVVQNPANWNLLDPDVLVWEAADGPSRAFVRDLFELRRMIEPEAAALAASRGTAEALAAIAAAMRAMENAPDIAESIRADLAFHRAILQATANRLVAAFGPAIETSLALSFKVSRSGLKVHDHVVPLHRAVADAIAAQNPDAARAAMLKLLDRSEPDAMIAAK